MLTLKTIKITTQKEIQVELYTLVNKRDNGWWKLSKYIIRITISTVVTLKITKI